MCSMIPPYAILEGGGRVFEEKRERGESVGGGAANQTVNFAANLSVKLVYSTSPITPFV